MKLINILLVVFLFLLSCNDAGESGKTKDSSAGTTPIPGKEQVSFFPVTDFIKGQITEIKNIGINPVKLIVINKKEDSSWVKIEDLDKELAPFLSPVIDSTNLSGVFGESKFLDQTINAFTFSYDPLKSLADSVQLRRWDVYIDPESGTVKRIYMLKKTTDHKNLQLTWQTNKSAKIVTISTDTKGNDELEKEVIIKWDL